MLKRRKSRHLSRPLVLLRDASVRGYGYPDVEKLDVVEAADKSQGSSVAGEGQDVPVKTGLLRRM
jgi:hypothetical protein